MNMYYELNELDHEYLKQYGQRYLVEYDTYYSWTLDPDTFQQRLSSNRAPWQDLYYTCPRIWIELDNKIQYVKFGKEHYIPNDSYPTPLPAVDLKEFVFVKLRAKELT
jgi:hypothetical protein